MTDKNQLLRLVVRFVEDDPLRAARYVEILDEENALQVLESLSPRELTKILFLFEPAFTTKLVFAGEPARVVPLLEKGGGDVCASVLLSLPEDKRIEFLNSMSAELRDQVQEILTFPEESAGKVMKTDYTAFHMDSTVKTAVAKLRARAGVGRAPSNIFVVDGDNKLVGVIKMRNIVIASEDTFLKDLMDSNVLTIGPFDQESEALRILSDRGFTSLPIVDSQHRLLGVVRATNLLGDAKETAAQDIQKLFGVGKDERCFSPVMFSLRKRLPWLHINLGTAFLAAAVVALFEDIIAKITVLAIYLPVVAGQGGNAGAQSLAVVMRGLVMREIPPHAVRRMLIKETVIGVLNGAVIGVVTALLAWAWNGNLTLAW